MTYKLHLGDCLEYMKSMPDKSVDAVITDPPYGDNNKSGWNGLHGDCQIKNDNSAYYRDEMLKLLHKDFPAVVFGKWKIQRPENTRAVLIWDKGGHSGMGDLSFPWKPNFEEIYILGRGFRGRRTSSVLSYYIHPTFNANRKHPNEKPLELIIELMSKCPDGTIFDPFMGSGTTGVAAIQLGRNFIGCEIDPDYFAIAKKRIEQAEMQPNLFESQLGNTETQKELL